jgi:hypothetical protein
MLIEAAIKFLFIRNPAPVRLDKAVCVSRDSLFALPQSHHEPHNHHRSDMA